MASEFRAFYLQAGPRIGGGPASRQIQGVLMRYNSVGYYGPRNKPEIFMPGAFGDVSKLDVMMNFQHQRSKPLARTQGGGLTLVDGGGMLSLVANLPKTQLATDTWELIQSGVVKSASVEYTPILERYENGIRIIERARLDALAIVDSGAYPESVVTASEVRRQTEQRQGALARVIETLATTRGQILLDAPVDCRCSPGVCTEARFQEDAFDDLLDEIADQRPVRQPGEPLAFEPPPRPTLFEPLTTPTPVPAVPTAPAVPPVPPVPGRNILAVSGEFSRPVASSQRGSLRMWKREKTIQLSIDVPDTLRGREIMDMLSVTPTIARPIIDTELSTYTASGTTTIYSRVHVRGVLVGPSDAAGGWRPLYIKSDPADDLPPEERAAPIVNTYRRPRWQ